MICFLETSYYFAGQIDIDAPLNNTKFHFNVGYSKLDGQRISGGSATMTYFPITLLASMTIPVFQKVYYPKPLIILGGGVTYVSLEKSQYGVSISEEGTNFTFVVGLGASLEPYQNYFLQFEALYHHVFENVDVNYLCYNFRVGRNFNF